MLHVILLFILKVSADTSLKSETTLEGQQYCSYRPRAEIFGLLNAEKIELEKGNECVSCGYQQECQKLKEKLTTFPSPEDALIGRDRAVSISDTHYVLGTKLLGPFPPEMEVAMFGLGCFWGAERLFWKQPGVYSTQAGYAGGYTPNPKYEEVCSGYTGHNEVVRVVYDPRQISYKTLLKLFWESHDPTQGMRQGLDQGTQYRSMIMVYTPEQREVAMESRNIYQRELFKASLGTITTEIRPVSEFYLAEEYHQQYLAKNPGGYCGLGGVGVKMPKSFE
ncbi:unnamed protein product [Blepharisma stoltei]|uniref:Mitochondrial peptide methionine sulfoxide reductase n=1 Tax=Blepharisma stoltei TaxID=1481888 RepID=A0AAU9JSI6_9CILI|nr:unnamed protein product [Blepharisma stoltei]